MKKAILKDIKNYFDLYGYELTIIRLKKIFTFVSYAKNSVPTIGSHTQNINKLNEKANVNILKVILHNDNTITLKTNKGYLKFIN